MFKSYLQGYVFKKKVKIQGQGHRVNIFESHGKFLPLEVLMWNIKALALIVQKVISRIKVFKI